MAALEKKHALEAQQENLRRQKEQLMFETDLAAAKAKLAVLASSEMETDGMNSYYSIEMKKKQVPPSSSQPLPTVLGTRKQTQITDPVTPMQQIQYSHSYSQQDQRTHEIIQLKLQMDMIVRT